MEIWKEPAEEARCMKACPAQIDIPRYIHLIGEGKFIEASLVIRERIPFPSIVCRVCFHPCEAKCRRGEVGEPMAINALKRFVTERASGVNTKGLVAKPSGKRVAIVGSGPAGLTAAYYLAKLCGHAVTVFEALPEPGGMLRVGIPAYRLPKDVLDAEINRVKAVGIDIKTNTKIDSLDELFEKGYNAIFVAIGAHRGIKMGVEGEESAKLLDCVSFLRDVNEGKDVKLGGKVAIIGGGNAAIDASRTALRLGAKEVTIVYRRSRDEMPANQAEVDEALREGVNIQFLTLPTKVTRANGKISMQCIRMKLGEPDASGRPRPEPISGSEFTMAVSNVIAAIGEKPEIPAQFRLMTAKGGTLQVDPDTLATSRGFVFAGGDVVTGPASVIQAIAAGRTAAISIDRCVGGDGVIDEKLAPSEEVVWHGFDESILDKSRSQMPLLPLDERVGSFAEVELGLTEEMAVEEAKRCLRCDQRIQLSVNLAKCAECLRCQLLCSLIYTGAFNAERARITIEPRIKVGEEAKISFTDECIGGCSLCVQYCSYEAITVAT